MNTRSIRCSLGLAIVLTACSVGPAEVTVGDQTTQVEPSELQEDVVHFGNALCFALFLGGALTVFAVIAVFRYVGAERRSAANGRRSSGPAVAIGRQGVLTLQFLVSPTTRTTIDSALQDRGAGPGALATVARVMTEHRGTWQAVAARGSTLMEEASAEGEAARVIALFDTRASQAGGDDVALLTVAVRAPFDYSGVMPGDMDGFATVLSSLFDVPTGASCAYQLGWSRVGYVGSENVVPGLVSV